MNSQSDKEEAAGTVFKASLPFLKSDECEKVKGQLSYIVQDMKNVLNRLFFEVGSVGSEADGCPLSTGESL